MKLAFILFLVSFALANTIQDPTAKKAQIEQELQEQTTLVKTFLEDPVEIEKAESSLETPIVGKKRSKLLQMLGNLNESNEIELRLLSEPIKTHSIEY